LRVSSLLTTAVSIRTAAIPCGGCVEQAEALLHELGHGIAGTKHH
jgi:hypothetical protein